MTKQEFLQRLEQLLWDLPEEERLDAVWYYEDYFADAGPENEQRVLRELKDPETVADNIRAGYLERLPAEEGGKAPDAAGEAAESAAMQSDAAKEQETSAGGVPGGNGGGMFGGRGGAPGGNGGMFGGSGAPGGRGGAPGRSTGMLGGNAAGSTGRAVLTAAAVILLIIFAVPIGSMLFAFCVLMFGLFAGFGISGVAMVAAGVVLIGNGITNAAVSSGIALLFSGSGLIVTALGIFFIVFAVNCGFRAVPAVFRGMLGLLRRLTGRRAA